jgi:nicotinate phosphoribosyltransferase
LAETEAELIQAPYKVLSDWQEDYGGNLLIILPDTFGTKNFLQQAPDWLGNWTGMRIDSGDPFVGGKLAIDWWEEKGQDPKGKLLIFSDALDVDAIEKLHQTFSGRVQLGFGWGTLLTNDFRNIIPDNSLDPLSLVCKVTSANDKKAVKISDNPNKATGPKQQIEYYKRIFNTEKQAKQPVIV